MSKKQIKATLADGTRVNDCIIIRREHQFLRKPGKIAKEKVHTDFYFVTVAGNGNYLDKVLTGSATASSCLAKIKAAHRFWRGKYHPGRNVVIVYFDYPGAKEYYKLIEF